MKIKITAGAVTLAAELYDTPTGRAVADALPITAAVNRWGGEIYCIVDVAAALETDSRDVLEAGDIAFWPPGNALCVFFGPTPASTGDEPRAASAVNVCGKILDTTADLWTINSGTQIVIEQDA